MRASGHPVVAVAFALVLAATVLAGLISAQEPQASPAGEPGVPTTLFHATVPSDLLPPNPVWVDVYRMEWDPGVSWPYDEAYRSLRIWCVEVGRLAITSSTPILVARDATSAPSTPAQTASPGAEITLEPGDCAVTPPNDPFTLQNPGPEAGVVVHGMVVPANVDVPGGYPFGRVREEEPFGSSMFSFELPSTDVEIRIERAPLEGGAGRQEAMDLFAPEPDEAVRVVRLAYNPDPDVAYAITVAPAAASSGTGPAAETLFSATLPAGAVPEAPGGLALVRYTVAPGTSFDFSTVCWVSPAADVWYVETGDFTIRPAAPAELVRGARVGGSTEPVAAGESVSLQPGDFLIYTGLPEVPGEFGNAGDEPVEGLVFGIWGEEVAGCPPVGMIEPWVVYLDGREWTLPPGPIDLTLTRLTVEPGASAPFPGSDTQRTTLVLDQVELGAAEFEGEGASRVLRNAGDEPVVAYALTIVPGSGATPVARTVAL